MREKSFPAYPPNLYSWRRLLQLWVTLPELLFPEEAVGVGQRPEGRFVGVCVDAAPCTLQLLHCISVHGCIL